MDAVAEKGVGGSHPSNPKGGARGPIIMLDAHEKSPRPVRTRAMIALCGAILYLAISVNAYDQWFATDLHCGGLIAAT